MLRRKLGTIARPGWQILANDKGFGRRVYDPNAKTPEEYLQNMGRIVRHIAGSQVPEGQIGAAADLARGEGDPTLNKLQTFGPLAGVTFSRGAPGGPAIGELYHAREEHNFKVNEALPDIRKMIQRGDITGANQRMKDLGIPLGLQDFYRRTTLNPKQRLAPRTVKDFMGYGTPEQIDRFNQARDLMRPPSP
jgi:hypothetical protein